MNQQNDQTVAHQAADVVDNFADEVRSAAHTAQDSVSHGRQRVQSWECNLESSVRENPKTALLLAAVVGAILFGWLKRR